MGHTLLRKSTKKNGLLNFLVISILSLIFTGCVSSKKIVYFQDDKGQKLDENIVNFQPTLQFGDILSINVSSLTPEAAAPFNVFESQGIGFAQNPLPYIVDTDGEINFPGIGKLKVSELTTKQLTNKLTKQLEPFLKDPIVDIRLLNFKVTVLGEVTNPGTYSVQNERITIIEAIGLAGDLNIQALRKSITLIREQGGKRVFVPIDITNKDIFNSPYFYLAQNDVIYVEPNKTKINSSAVGPNTVVFISSLTLLVSITAILLGR
jgi:polysaccharide export outer membrane protein